MNFKSNKKYYILAIMVIFSLLLAFIINLNNKNNKIFKDVINERNEEIKNNQTEEKNTVVKEETTETEEKTSNNIHYLGETLYFDYLEITLGDSYSFDTVSNSYSDYNGRTVVKVPVTVKNLKDEEHNLNMFKIKTFSSTGVETDSIASYFTSDSIDFGGELMPNASYTKYFYFLYDEPGTYIIMLKDIYEKKYLSITVN